MIFVGVAVSESCCRHDSPVGSCVCCERKCREIGELPSMMWKRSIVQASSGAVPPRSAVALVMTLLVFASVCGGSRGADLVIEIPGSGGGLDGSGGSYRLDYRPPHGNPAPNFTVPARASTINFQGLPGTKYHFMLYYSNGTFADLLTWNQTIVTAPEPPTNLTVTLGRNKQATISWAPPAHGEYTGFRLKVVPLTERAEGPAPLTLTVDAGGELTHTLRDLAPGATYQLHALTLLHDKESAAYASTNFTTKPNTPGKFIVWFRNETTLLVLWQPPYPPGFYTHYKVSIMPPDARDSELYVEKEGEPPGPAQAAFKGLMPGRAYNISVQTVSEPEISAPTTAQYRTVPLRPRNVTAPARDLGETSFRVTWLPPADDSEFEKYQVTVTGESRRLPPVVRPRDDPPELVVDGLEPGARYTVTVKTMSGKVTSWPASAELTLKPLPVRELRWAGDGALTVRWTPAPGSQQDEYRVAWETTAPAHGEDSSSLSTTQPVARLEALLPGRNYTVSVAAVSRGVAGAAVSLAAATRPLAPLLETATPQDTSLRLAWRSDVTSRQDGYRLRYRRVEPPASTQDYITMSTESREAVISDLFPGAVYEVRVAAVSHGLASEELVVEKPVRPLPPRSLTVTRASSTGVTVTWSGAPASASHTGHFLLRYRGVHEAAWRALPPLPPGAARADLADLTPGARYTLQLDAVSGGAPGVGSGAPLSADHTVRPSPVSNVAQLADTRNVTLEWPRGAGRVDRYRVTATPHGDGAAPPPLSAPAPAPPADRATVRVVLAPLEPGARYTIAITAISYDLTSDVFTMETRTRPLIQSEMTIVNEQEDNDENDTDTAPKILVTYTPTPASATRFDSYRFRLERGAPAEGGAEGEAAQEAWAAAEAGVARRVTFAGLVPGALYNVTMWTVAGNVSSHPVQRQARLFPRPPPRLNATARGAREVALAWAEPAGVRSHFRVQYLAAADTLRTLTAERAHLELTALRPHTLYTFTVTTVAGAGGPLPAESRGVSVSAATLQAPPPPPADFHATLVQPARVTLAWRLPPDDANGVLQRFLLDYHPAAEPARTAHLEFPPSERSGTVSGLAPGTAYVFLLRGETGGGRGAAARAELRTAILPPPPPPPGAAPALHHATPTTVTVRYRADLFSPANGNVTAYTLVVAEEPALGAAAAGAATPPALLPAWRDVQRLPRWPPYQVTEPYFPFGAGRPQVERFTVGAERCSPPARAYCNGPLKPDTTYYVKLRAFTAPDKFTDTDYLEVHTEADRTAWTVALWAGGGLALAGGGAALALWARRRRVRRAAGAAPPPPRASRPVRVADFVEHYRRMAADSDFRFSEEFEELKAVGRDQPTTAADLPVNRPKNRFTNILPYDHSRVKLRPVDDEEGSDYINANYVPGFASPREFIVTQGPLHATRDDFWRMCWESGTRGIVMLTRCVEKGREKCDRYWPYDTRPVYYGDICVTALNESRYPDWTVTELMVARGAEQRVLTHFHFTTWPDFGVPEPPTALARFVRAFRERCPPDTRPVVVHCSAGVGRSGTFITLDTALRQLAAGADSLDVFGMVHAMRRERVFMVQTEQQYICIHQCLVAVLEGQDLQPPPHNHHHNPAFEDDEGIAESGM